MKSASLLKRELKLLYKDLEPKIKNLDNTLKIQTGQKYDQNEITKFKCVKKILCRIKALQKCKCKRLQPNKLIQKATNNLNNIKSTPKPIQSKLKVFDFHRIEKVQKDSERRVRSEINLTKEN